MSLDSANHHCGGIIERRKHIKLDDNPNAEIRRNLLSDELQMKITSEHVWFKWIVSIWLASGSCDEHFYGCSYRNFYLIRTFYLLCVCSTDEWFNLFSQLTNAFYCYFRTFSRRRMCAHLFARRFLLPLQNSHHTYLMDLIKCIYGI